MVNKGPFIEWIKNSVKETTINTYAEEAIPTPVSKTEELAMLIHMIEWHTDDPQCTEGDYASVLTGLYSQSQSGAVGLQYPDTIDAYQQSIMLGRYQGTLSEYFEYYKDPQVKHFDPPILYAKSFIYHGVQGVQQPAGALKTSVLRIGYTLEKVTKDAFIDALVS